MSVLLVLGTSLAACTHHQPYRSPLSGAAPAALAEPVPCAVDPSLQVETASDELPADLPLCEEAKADDGTLSPALERRYYQTWDQRLAPGAEPRERVRGDYYLSFIEFDDQGWFADLRQMDALFELLSDLEEQETEALIYVYAHGWKHNASPCDNNVVCFAGLLERTDLAEKMGEVMTSDDPKPRKVVGVYLGWRGLPAKAGPLSNLSFWSRKAAAARVGRGGVLEVLTRLEDYRNARQGATSDSPPASRSKTQLLVTGHSFGGLVVYSALSHALMERAARSDPASTGAYYNAARSFGDFVMLVNPAFEGSLYEPLFNIAANRCYDARDGREAQPPVMMIVTSDADSATRKAFPIGRTLGTLFQHSKSADQKRAMRRTVGHDPRYRTHALAQSDQADAGPLAAERIKDSRSCPCPYLTPTSELDLDTLLGPYLDTLMAEALGSVTDDEPEIPYGEGVSLEPIGPEDGGGVYAPTYPYLVVSTDKRLIPDHNAIYNDRFILFTQRFILKHVVLGEPWTEAGTSTPACWSAPGPAQLRLPREWSCQNAGRSCTSPR